MENIFNNNFLNSLFTSDEFDFIEHIDSDFETLQKKSEKMQANRDVIVKLINGLNDAIYYKGLKNESDEKEQNILRATQNAFDLINCTIDILQENIELSNSIKKDIVDILIKVDSNVENKAPSNYENEITNLKNKISDICKRKEDANQKIETNINAITDFFNTDSVKEVLNAFSIELSPEQESNSIDEDNYSNTEETVDLDYTSNTYSENNNLLLVSEKDKSVYLPYSKEEVLAYLQQYPDKYTSFDDVVNKEFIFSSDLYLKHQVVARFRETYALIRDREAKSVLEAFKYAMDLMFHYDLNPVIIAACKSQTQLENYIKCLEKKDLSKFDDFEIKFEVTPFKV